MPVTESQILKVLSAKTGMTATAIAKKLGMTKARDSFTAQLRQLVEAGQAVEKTEGRYVLYMKASAQAAVAPSAKKKTVAVAAPVVEDEANKTSDIPEASARMLNGYKSEVVGGKKVITTPASKKLTMDKDSFLIVINEQPKYVVKDASDVISCIREYAVDNNMATFTVSDMYQSKNIGTKNDVMKPDNGILFLKISKHNKAA